MDEPNTYVFQRGDFKTLPLYIVVAKLTEDLHAYSRAKAQIQIDDDPDYEPKAFKATPELLDELSRNPQKAIDVTRLWLNHVTDFSYFVQFKDDADRSRIAALQAHTEVLSILCDSRLKIDPTVLWKVFDGLCSFSAVHEEYRADKERDEKWSNYAARLKKIWERLGEHKTSSARFVLRMVKQIELQSDRWTAMEPIRATANEQSHVPGVELFYSYSHKDEALRDRLQTHLSALHRQGVITQWHDRRISAGKEWEGQIDEHLNSAKIILLLISADFIASDYCYDREVKRAMERHNSGEARIIPVILRACDWQGLPFGKNQALPKDGEPITSWANIDEAFTDVAIGIRKAASELRTVK